MPTATTSTAPPATTSTHGVLDGGVARRRFTLARRAPHPAAARWIERFWETAWDLPPGTHHLARVLPHPCVNVVVYPAYAEVASPEVLPGGPDPARTVAMVHGIVARPDERLLRGQGRAFGATLRPGAFASLSAVPVRTLAERPATLAEAFGPDGVGLERRLLAAADDADALAAAFEGFVAARGPGEDRGLDLVHAVVADMLRRGPGGRVEEIAADHGVSARTLQRVFRERVGVGPKWVLQRHRDHVLAERLAGGDTDLAALAAELGYVDQAHMSARFRAVVGCSPGAYAHACATA